MKVQPEAAFMDKLSPGLRMAAEKLYLVESLEGLIAFRFGHEFDHEIKNFSLSGNKLQLVLDAVILTRLSEINLHKKIPKERCRQLRELVLILLAIDKDDNAIEYLSHEAKKFMGWYLNLLKMI
jgi:hypothetical protein